MSEEFVRTACAGANIAFAFATLTAFDLAILIASCFVAKFRIFFSGNEFQMGRELIGTVFAGADVALAFAAPTAVDLAKFITRGFVAFFDVIVAESFGMPSSLAFTDFNLDKGVTFLEPCIM